MKPKFRIGQVVYWGNGKHQYRRVHRIDTVYGYKTIIGYLYDLSYASENMLQFSCHLITRGVSEEVLRGLTKIEKGCVK